ncbi:MAG: ribose 5-phosphate isomerase A [Thermobacillus sp. ZCTH02-B1]|nr:MAG: ribose 5-phosphate isomerase A [Thermobacillus sp. ZCTH02-B1]
MGVLNVHEQQTAEKRRVGEKAAELVEDGMIVGLGTGSTAYWFIKKLAERVAGGLRITGVATSVRTAELAESLGIRVVDVNEVGEVDLTVDGADEIDDHFNAIKGGGGALLREKIVASISRRMVVIVDSTKRVERLGRFPLPVEMVPFGYKHTLRKLEQAGCAPRLREKDGAPFVTDGGHYIVDLHLGRIDDPERLAGSIGNMPGVVEHGLFIGLVTDVLIAEDGEVRMMKRA